MATKTKKSNSLYLKHLAVEHGHSFDTYTALMKQFDVFLSKEYHFTVESLKGKILLPWQVDLLRRLNPTDFQLETIKELGEFESWHLFIRDVQRICSE
jgi:hypothetical protein